MERKHQTLDVIKMYSTLTEEHWRHCLVTALKSCSMDKLMSWRYGLQAGLADADQKGVATDALVLWVLKRIKNVEKCAKLVLKKKHHINIAGNYKDKTKSAVDALMAKRKRDRDFEEFLKRSAF